MPVLGVIVAESKAGDVLVVVEWVVEARAGAWEVVEEVERAVGERAVARVVV